MEGFKRLENKYGIKVVVDDYGNGNTYYKMYSADGCPWENGLTKKGVYDECTTWSKQLLEIKSANSKGA